MNKALFTLLLALFAVSATNCHSGEDKAVVERQPNIVLIFIDDLGYADISCFGNTPYQTPHIDKLASGGMRFTSFYASQAVCSASRASLLTGCYAERVGILGALNSASNKGIHSDELLIPELLQDAGYVNGIFGKWHLGHHEDFLPLQHGFDTYVGLAYSNDMWPVGYDGVPLKGKGKRKSNYPPLKLYNGNNVIDTIASLDDQAQLTTLYTKEAVKFINEHKDQAFFLYMPHSMVHVPIAVSEKFKGKSKQGLFADVMLELDWSVGEIMKALKRNEIDENTLIIFTSDNGPWLNYGNHAGSALPFREGKGTMWEGGPRVATIMNWPCRIEEGSMCDQLTSTIDILPTLADITGVDLPEQTIDGISILPLMESRHDAKGRENFYYYYGGELIAVRNQEWKLVFPHRYRSYDGMESGNDGFPGPYGKGEVHNLELYNLKNDISETENVAAQYPQMVADLNRLGDMARKELGDRIKNIKGEGVRKPGRLEQEKMIVNHKAVGKEVILTSEYAFQYAAQGPQSLTNGVMGSFDFTDEEWLGFQGNNVETIIDLGEIMTIEQLVCGFLVNQGSWIFSPSTVVFSVSQDGQHYSEVDRHTMAADEENNHQEIARFSSKLENTKIRFVKIEALNIGKCPDWHEGAGGKAWLFLDEVVIK